MPETLDQPVKRPMPTREPVRKIDWKLAATLRAGGLTYQQVSDRVGAISGESIRLGLMRRGVVNAIRTTTLTTADRMVKDNLAKLSEDTKATLASTVLAHSQALEKVEVKPNIKSIKALGQAIEPLARTAKIVHGWGEAQKQSLVSVQVLGDVRLDDMFKEQDCGVDTTIESVPQIPASTETPQEPPKA